MKMPRIELHCHLDGSLTQSYIENMLGRSVTQQELQVDPDCRNLAEYLGKFDLPLLCLQDEKGLYQAGYDFIRHMAAEQMDYVEVRFAPLLSCEKGLSCHQVIESLLSGLERGRKETGVEYGVIVCAMRHHSVEENWRMLKIAREYWGKGVCAADLAGNEAAFPMSQFTELFCRVKDMGMPFTIHAGECGDAENIRQAVLSGASRIGHGIAMRGHADIQQLCKERSIGIEMCPISNLQTKAVESPAQYPMREFLDNGLLVTLNTDNRTVSGTSLDKEIMFVKETYGICEGEIVGMMRNAVEVSFADADVKKKLMEKLL
ncbi:MAG: adenosine deaminase [Ruminococcus sp.]|nr:adenosine deaminase [Ruminococcus sp.]